MTTQIRAFVAPPPSGLAAAANVGGGTFAAATYFWKATFVTPGGETYPSNEATVAVALNGTATITWAAPPAKIQVSSVKIYRGTVTNTEDHLIATVPWAAGATAPPVSYTDTGTAGSVNSPPSTAFATVTRDAAFRIAKSNVSALSAAAQINALSAIGSWNDAGGTGDRATDAQKLANANGLVLQEI